MRNNRIGTVFVWLAVGVAAAIALPFVFRQAYPLFPRQWTVSGEDAEVIALERFRDLGDPVGDPYVVTTLDGQPALEYRLNEALEGRSSEEVRRTLLAADLLAWQVVVHDADAPVTDWAYRARVSPDGRITDLRMRVAPQEEGGALAGEAARARADEFLAEQGFDLSLFDEPEVRSRQLESRTDTDVQYRDRAGILGADVPYGLKVSFAGERLTGFEQYLDDPDRNFVTSLFRPFILLNQAWVFLPLILLPLVAIPFVRKYHAGEIGVRRGVQIGAIIAGCGLLTMLVCGRAASSGWSIGPLTRPQTTAVVSFQMLALFFLPMALMAMLSWSVGESLCREKWGSKLAAFDALFKGDIVNATFARASLRGLVSGIVLVAALWGLAAILRPTITPSTSFLLGPWWESTSWFSIPLLAFGVAYVLYSAIFGQLLLVPLAVRWLGRWAGALVAVLLGGILFFPAINAIPLGVSIPLWFLAPAVYVFLFMRYGIFTVLMGQLTAWTVGSAVPLLQAAHPAMEMQAALALLGVALPLLISIRHVTSDKHFVYKYEDVPPHVRRIAERERQKVELETARRIQSSILPELPPELNGVQLASTYLPATEVGGDFYDVLALEDGRLAVAVGDVAGHGVSSGLVMSMAKSALAVQVSFNPDVEAVFNTLNRMVFQSARKRLLATLCYAVIDPQRREMFYASAGHLFPYRITKDGEVEALESISYPLGVRDSIEVRERAANLDSGDILFLFSDGVVEARAPDSDNLFGFDRLEESLGRHAGGTVGSLRDGVLADLDRFTRSGPREDDLTLLVLQVP